MAYSWPGHLVETMDPLAVGPLDSALRTTTTAAITRVMIATEEAIKRKTDVLAILAEGGCRMDSTLNVLEQAYSASKCQRFKAQSLTRRAAMKFQ